MSAPGASDAPRAGRQTLEAVLRAELASWEAAGLRRALDRGLRLIQIREKDMPAPALRLFAGEVIALAHRYRARVLLNGDPQLARECGADGVHLTAARTLMATKRPDCDWVAASCHNAAEVAHAIRIGADFAVVGPVLPTPSHPDAPALGWERFQQTIQDTPLPVYALGGMQRRDLEAARLAGAHGIAMLRGAWD